MPPSACDWGAGGSTPQPNHVTGGVPWGAVFPDARCIHRLKPAVSSAGWTGERVLRQPEGSPASVEDSR